MARLTAFEVSEGDSLPDLDNGYVFDTESDTHGNVTLTFHDRNGDECYLTVSEDFELNVKTGEPV